MLEVVEAHLHPWLESYNYWHHRLTAVAGIRKVVLIQILLIWHVYYSRSFHRILPWSTGILNIRDRGGAVVGLRENSFLKFFQVTASWQKSEKSQAVTGMWSWVLAGFYILHYSTVTVRIPGSKQTNFDLYYYHHNAQNAYYDWTKIPQTNWLSDRFKCII